MGERGRQWQGPKQKKGKGKKCEMATVAAVDNDDKELFAFTCMSNFAHIAKALQVPKSRLGTYRQWGQQSIFT